MTKLKSVLSDDDIHNVFRQFQSRHFTDLDAMRHALAKEVEQAALAKLHEQDPVGTITVDAHTGVDVVFHQFQGLVDGTKLYAHPTQSMGRKIVGYSDKEGEYFFQKLETANRIASSLDFYPVYIDIDDCASALSDKTGCTLENVECSKQDPIRDLISIHEQMLEDNSYAYFELAYTRHTEWMAWICSKARKLDPDRKILAKGQGSTPEEACLNALSQLEVKGAQAKEHHRTTKNITFEPSNITKLSLSVDTKEVQALLQSYLDGLDEWQLAPKEPTGTMLFAGSAFALSVSLSGTYTWNDYLRELYKTMLAEAVEIKIEPVSNSCKLDSLDGTKTIHEHRSEFISAYKTLLCPGEKATFALDRVTGCFINEFVEHAWVVWQIAKGLLTLDNAKDRGCTCDE